MSQATLYSEDMFVLLVPGSEEVFLEPDELITKLKDKNIGILITDHNVNETLSVTDRAYLMFEGALLKSGTAEELAEDEKVRKVYMMVLPEEE